HVRSWWHVCNVVRVACRGIDWCTGGGKREKEGTKNNRRLIRCLLYLFALRNKTSFCLLAAEQIREGGQRKQQKAGYAVAVAGRHGSMDCSTAHEQQRMATGGMTNIVTVGQYVSTWAELLKRTVCFQLFRVLEASVYCTSAITPDMLPVPTRCLLKHHHGGTHP
ncbi:unnamed protein product, partial [Ectocarpus sp. 8 AP-2014]